MTRSSNLFSARSLSSPLQAILLVAGAAAAILSTTTSPAEEPRQLNGTQAQKVVTLAPGTSPYLVTGTYDVPPESELIIEAGARLLFAKDAALNIQGTLRINGSKDAPVELSGKATGAGFWQGVRLNRSNSTRIDYARISGAKNGIYMHASKPSIENSILASNIVGLCVGEYGSGSEPIVKNCLITQNHEDGVVLRASSAVFEHCTISKNGGWGIRGEYYSSPSISECVISDNKMGGLWCKLYTCKPKAHNSVFLRNGKYEVFNESPEIWDFSGNWWGADDTQVLKSKGDTANLRSIRDGRDKDASGLGEVVLSDFLETEPTNCGSSLRLARR